MKALKLLFVSLIILASIASADVPQMINYNGFLTKPSGSPVNNGDYEITFTIYSGMPPLAAWTSGPQNVTVTSGLFDYQLGSAVPFPQGIFLSETLYWLGIKVGDDPEISPRTRLVSAPFAFQALQADKADYAETDNSGWVDDGPVVRLETATDWIGIGTTAPGGRLEIQSDGGAATGVAAYPFRIRSSDNTYYLIHTSEDATGDAHLSLRDGSGITAIALASDPVDDSYINAGNVGIGTTTPDEKLTVDGNVHVTGDLTVDGNINSLPGGTGIVPVGAIIAWAKSLAGVPQELPDNFMVCDGSIIDDIESPMCNQALPDLNGEQRHLRGSSISGATGGTDSHNHQWAKLTTEWADVLSGRSTGWSGTYTHRTYNSIGGEITWIMNQPGGYLMKGDFYTSNSSASPPYYEVVWIMRIK